MGCYPRPRARANPLAVRYITHSIFKRAFFEHNIPRISSPEFWRGKKAGTPVGRSPEFQSASALNPHSPDEAGILSALATLVV
jgi:hypothetical protein